MSKDKLSVRTVVTVDLEVHDTQPWSGDTKAEHIHERAKEAALHTIACLNRAELRVVGNPRVKMVITEDSKS